MFPSRLRSPLVLLLLHLTFEWTVVSAWSSGSSRSRSSRNKWMTTRNTQTTIITTSTTQLFLAKRSKRQQSRQDADDLNRWYENVDADATPDEVFWEEMERQRMLSSGNAASNLEERPNGGGSSTSTGTAGGMGAMFPPNMPSSSSLLSQSASPLSSSSPSSRGGVPSAAVTKNVEATLSEYAAYAVEDNWLDEELQWMMEDDSFTTDNVKSLEEQLDEWEANGDDDDDDVDDDEYSDKAWMQSDDPWDHWGEDEEDSSNNNNKRYDQPHMVIDPTNKAAEFLFNDSDDDAEELARQEREFVARISKLTIKCGKLERAKNNPKAAAYFQRDPNVEEGFDRLWVSAIDNACFKNLVGTFRNYGVEFAHNFGDWEDGSVQDGFFTIEEVASYKARLVYNITGLPCIASRTSFEIEPIPIKMNTGGGIGGGLPASRMAAASPRVASGYRFNNIGMHVDYICDALRPICEPTRVTRFRTCLCYYDGEMEVFDYGTCDCDLHFANSMRTFIPMAQAINEMMNTLKLTFGLEYQKWLSRRVDAVTNGFGAASVKLRDRVLKEAKVLPNDIIDVSAFMDSQVDVNLMDECAKELANNFMEEKPSKILTVATTGLVIALPMAKYLQVPVVYARKERNIVMADTFKAGYSSKTVGKNRELLVSKSHLHEDDRVLIIDDFLSSGSSQEALLRIVSDAGATAVGVGVLLEKVYDSGRQSLSGFDIPIHSLCRVASVQGGVIQLFEEDGYDRMRKNSK